MMELAIWLLVYYLAYAINEVRKECKTTRQILEKANARVEDRQNREGARRFD